MMVWRMLEVQTPQPAVGETFAVVVARPLNLALLAGERKCVEQKDSEQRCEMESVLVKMMARLALGRRSELAEG